MDELLTVQEIADKLKVNPQTVRNWIDRGELQAVRVGPRRVRVSEDDLLAFLEGEESRGRVSSTATRLAVLERRIDDLAAAVDELRNRPG